MPEKVIIEEKEYSDDHFDYKITYYEDGSSHGLATPKNTPNPCGIITARIIE